MLSCDWVGVVCMDVCVLEGLEGLSCDWVGVGGSFCIWKREFLYLEEEISFVFVAPSITSRIFSRI